MQNNSRYLAIHERYLAIHDRLASGNSGLCPKDYHFYRRHCMRNGITPLPFTLREDVSAVPHDDSGYYRQIMERLSNGRYIDAPQYRYLRRYCRRKGMPMPSLQSDMRFWLKKEGVRDDEN